MAPAEVGPFEPASFRDPAARVLRHDGQILRYLTPAAWRDFERLSSTRFYREFTDAGRLVATTEASRAQIPPLSDPWVAVLRHQTIPVVSYPYEWCFSMLQDAALLQIDLLLAALDEGMTLKDATPFNIQWIGPRPVCIDIGSFTAAAPGEPWAGDRQVCETFLYPLFLQADTDVPLHPGLRGSLDGVEAGHITRLISARDRLRPGVFPHVYLLSKLQSRDESTHRTVRKDLRAAGFTAALITHTVRRMRHLVARLTWRRARSTWSEYADGTPYDQPDRARKKQCVLRAPRSAHRAGVWDLGGHTGEYSRAVRACADRVIAVEADPLAIDRLSRAVKVEHASTILPVVGNLTDPSPGLGWRHHARQTLAARSRPDLILARARMHHLSIGRNVPLPEVVAWVARFEADGVIEFVAPQDAMVAPRVSNRAARASGDTPDRVEACVAEHCVIAETERLPSGTRTMYDVRPTHANCAREIGLARGAGVA